MSAAEKKAQARRVLDALREKRAPRHVLARAERLYHRLACDEFVDRHMARKTAEAQ